MERGGTDRRSAKKKPFPPEGLFSSSKKVMNVSSSVSFTPTLTQTAARTAARPPNRHAPATIATRAEGLDSAAGAFLLCQARYAEAETQTATPVSRQERQSLFLLLFWSFIFLFGCFSCLLSPLFRALDLGKASLLAGLLLQGLQGDGFLFFFSG